MSTPAIPKKPGRPAKFGQALTPAERAAAYRARRLDAAYAATDGEHNLADASTRALLDRLAVVLAQLDAPGQDGLLDAGRRSIAGSILATIRDRHAIPMPPPIA